MANTGIDKYPREVKVAAIKRLQEGGRGVLTAIAKELGCKKSTVKYWWDNKERILSNGEVPIGLHFEIAKATNEGILEICKDLIDATRKLRNKRATATYENLLSTVDVLAKILRDAKPINTDSVLDQKISDAKREVFHETKITVQQFVATQKEREKNVIDASVDEDEKKDLATPPPEHETKPSNRLDELPSGGEDVENKANNEG